jgi:hypothetical protein
MVPIYREDEQVTENNLLGITPYLFPVVSKRIRVLEILIISHWP